MEMDFVYTKVEGDKQKFPKWEVKVPIPPIYVEHNTGQ